MYDIILRYVRTGKLPEDLEKNDKDSLRRKIKNFLEKSGLLYFRDEKRSVDLQVSVCNGFTHNLFFPDIQHLTSTCDISGAATKSPRNDSIT